MIFPDWGTAPAQETEEALPLFREWAVDWDTGAFALRDGKPYLVSGDEALKLWITKALNPESRRFFYTAWSWDYGNELETLLGGAWIRAFWKVRRASPSGTLCWSAPTSEAWTASPLKSGAAP